MLGLLFGFATLNAEKIPEGVMPAKRQVVGTGVTSSTPITSSNTTPDPSTPVTSDTAVDPTPSSTSPDGNTDNNGGTTTDEGTTSQQNTQDQQQSTTIPTSVEVTTTNADGSTITTKISTNTVAPATKTKDPDPVETSTNSKGENVVKVGSKTINPSTLEHKTTIRKPLVTSQTKHSTYTSFWTSDGQVYSEVYTTENVFASTTGYATATIAPGLANGGGNGSNLSTNTKKIIGGVVGGIGGAILIGGLAFVAWRLWGKKKAANEQDDFYEGSASDSIANQKRQSTGVLSSSAYSDTTNQNAGLERYQNPNGAINTSSNF